VLAIRRFEISNLKFSTALVAGVLAAGCMSDMPALGPLKPRMAAGTGPESAAGEAPTAGVSPVRAADAGGAPREPAAASPAAPRAVSVARPEDSARYEARLGDVDLPVAARRPPVLARTEEGEAPRLVNAVLAEVNGEVITREDILGPLRPQMAQWRKDLAPQAFESQCRVVIDSKLRESISVRLVVQEAKAKLTDDEKKQVDAAIDQTVKNLIAGAGSLAALEARLEKQGSSLAREKERERERMIVQRYLREKVAPTVHVTHSELLDYYNRVRAERYERPDRMRLGLILLKKSTSANPQHAAALAQAVHQRAGAGEDFARLAARYSEDPMSETGGDWGLVTRGSFRVKAVDDALFRLEGGRVAPLVETDDAYYIVKALERQPAHTVPFTEVQADLEDEIRDRKYNEQVSRHVQGLYEKAYVRIMLDNL
jgi:parvulin-like peptidyl-prolyl isomerase